MSYTFIHLLLRFLKAHTSKIYAQKSHPTKKEANWKKTLTDLKIATRPERPRLDKRIHIDKKISFSKQSNRLTDIVLLLLLPSSALTTGEIAGMEVLSEHEILNGTNEKVNAEEIHNEPSENL